MTAALDSIEANARDTATTAISQIMRVVLHWVHFTINQEALVDSTHRED
jgi:hypothetical protein